MTTSRMWVRAATTLGVTTLGACGTGPTAPKTSFTASVIHTLPMATQNVTIHPFGAVDSHSLSLFGSGTITFPEAIHGLVAETLQNPYLQANITQSPLASNIAAGGERYEVSFTYKGTPVWGQHMTASLLSDRSSLMLGSLPALKPEALAGASNDFPNVVAVQGLVTRSLSVPGSEAAISFGNPTAYYFPKADGTVAPVQRMLVTIGGLPHEVVADEGQIYSVSNFYYDATGSAQIFQNNVNDKTETSYTLNGLVGDGTLHSQYLQTFLPSNVQQAVESSETFNFPPTDIRFDEVNAYAHTDDHLSWLLGIGGQTYGDLPLHIMMHQLPGGTTNNALFIPGDVDSGQPFEIVLGDGDGQILQNLSTDRDVPSHESGHYIIYNYLKQTSGESLALHEGMADLLVFLQQDNPCLGKSICPAGSTACIVPGQCLRTADNTFAYNDQNWQEWTQQLGGQCCGHKHGQVLSGLVWDLAKNNVLSAADLSTMTLKAITYFKVDSGIRDFLLALLTADKELYACKYDSQLRQYMQARNLISLISDVPTGCASIPALAGGGQLGQLVNGASPSSPSGSAPGFSPPTSSGDSHTTSHKGALSCGTIAGHPDATTAGLALLLLALTPMLVSAAKPAVARARARRQERRNTR